MPSVAALIFKRRWTSGGTFRIWTMVFDMTKEYFHRFIMSTRGTVGRTTGERARLDGYAPPPFFALRTVRNPRWFDAERTSPLPRVPIM